MTFVNGTGAPVNVSVSWLVDGFVTPPGAPFVGSHDIRATLRLWGVNASTVTPALRGVTGTTNDRAGNHQDWLPTRLAHKRDVYSP